MSADHRRIPIAGGGPVGLLCAWLIGRHGLPVRLFDNNNGPQPDPRAATTHPATLHLLAEDGLADDMARVGLVAPIFQFWTGRARSSSRNSTTRFSETTRAIPLSCSANNSRPQNPFSNVCANVRASNRSTTRYATWRRRLMLSASRFAGRPASSPTRAPISSAPMAAQHRAPPLGHRIRRLHLARALHRSYDAVRFRNRTRLLLPQLFRRPRRVVQLLQSFGRWTAGALAHRLSHRSGTERRRDHERRRRAGAHPVVLSVCRALRDRPSQPLCDASARRRTFRKAACCSPAMPRMSTIRSAAWA